MNVIHKLDPTTVNRIAAGEVVQRPSAAIKELLENSIDAGSKQITITIKNGGLDVMQIQDDGCGIRKEDLGIVCERFTTSKLSNFDDLKSISTFGFRGEALASITHVARVTITTKTAQSPCAYKGKYSDGKLVPLKLGDSAEPKPCAGVNGTTITVEDLFYNMRTRRSAFKNTSEQYQRILDVVTRYAIHYGDSHIAFTCRKQGQAIPDIHTPSSTSSTLDNIKIAYGSTLTRELIGCEFYFIFDEGDEKHDVSVGSSKNKCFNVKEGGSALQCSVKGYVTNANYSTKRSTFIFFINHRLVECPPIKKMLESFYAEILPKCGYPFVYLSIEVPPQIVDVNIHPTKKEVCFLYEDQLLQQIYGQMKSLLSSANESRSFATQSLISVRDDPPTESSSVASIYADTKMNQELKTDCKSEDVVNNDIDNDISASIALYSSSSTEICDELQKSEMELSQFSDHNNEMAILESAIAPKKRRAAEIESSTELFDKSVSYFVSRGSTRAATQAPNKLIRTDPLIARIDQFFPTAPATKRNLSDVGDSDICVESKNNRFSTSGPRSGLRYDELESDDSSAVTEPNKKRLKKKSNIALCLPIGSCLCCAPDSSDKSNFINNGSVIDIGSKNADTSAPSMTLRLQPIKETSCQYISIMELVVEIQASFHSGVDSMLKKLTYVGVINSAYMLGQVDTKLLLVDFNILARHLFYQIAIRQFGENPAVILQNPVRIYDYVMEALFLKENQWSDEDGCRSDICAAVQKLLLQKRDMLKEYFSIHISEDGAHLLAVPELLMGYSPNPYHLPTFLLRLATAVDWDQEKSCFRDISVELSTFYSRFELESDINCDDDKQLSDSDNLSSVAKASLQNLFIPAFKQLLIPQRSLLATGTSIIEVTSLEKLYKVFERC